MYHRPKLKLVTNLATEFRFKLQDDAYTGVIIYSLTKNSFQRPIKCILYDFKS